MTKPLAAIALLALSAAVTAAEQDANYVPYPGTITVDVQAIDTPITAQVRFESYPGFQKVVWITLPGLQVPSPASKSGCERQLAADALAFTGDFLADAKKVTMRDMHMVTSADDEGYAPIATNKGSLGAKLQAKGYARASSTDPKKPWCKDEE
jgi:hypothetical protein